MILLIFSIPNFLLNNNVQMFIYKSYALNYDNSFPQKKKQK